MWWCDNRKRMSTAARLAVILAVAGLTAGCFEPLYGRNPSLGDDSVRDKLAEVVVAVMVTPTSVSVSIDPVTGRPQEEIGGVNATYQMVEIATGRIVLKDSTFAHVGYDIPGSQQRFAKQRALLDAEDRAAKMAAEAIRNRLASYFVAGT